MQREACPKSDAAAAGRVIASGMACDVGSSGVQLLLLVLMSMPTGC
jgi:hypothetical protein